ncbi:hypothetical protein [Candidatus Poriferisodalis sp.]|uniref:hypothetical protein n=1 Tax=Candidatus Poriferisodalis sp. TaxID=3101277 RepID=UPI003B0116E8
MSDGDTRKIDKKSLKDPAGMMVPLAKFRSFQRSDQIWVIGGILFLIILMNVVFYGGPTR